MEGHFEAMATLTFTRRNLTHNVILRSVHVRYIPNNLNDSAHKNKRYLDFH